MMYAVERIEQARDMIKNEPIKLDEAHRLLSEAIGWLECAAAMVEAKKGKGRHGEV